MRNFTFPLFTFFLFVLIILINACSVEPTVSPKVTAEIPSFLQGKLKLRSIEDHLRVANSLEQLFREKAEAQYPILALEADFQDLTLLRFDCFNIYLSPLDEPGDFLALLHSPGYRARLLFVEWGVQNELFYLQTLASNGEGLRFFEGRGVEGLENPTRMGALYNCCYGSDAAPVSWLSRFKKDWLELLGSQTEQLSSQVSGIPVGGILAMHGYAGVYLD